LRVGVYGGVFNPPHMGHLVCAQEAHHQLELDVVVFVPVGVAPHRTIEQDPGAEVRFEMVEMAVGADDRFRVSRVELERAGPSYTADTLRELKQREPESELFLIMGGDQAAALPEWREPEEILAMATVAVFERAQDGRGMIEATLGNLRGGERVKFLEVPRMDISSSLVRRRAGAREPIRYLVPDTVADFIGARSLYGASVPAA
jgi:nicotinate-nucleotide adenylyltransferase